MNDFYARDTSGKIKAVKKSTFKAGKFIGAYAPYGYVKDLADKPHLIIDEPAAAIVRRIFALRCQGLGYREIASILNGEGIAPPREHLFQIQEKPNNFRSNGLWNGVTVKVLCRNEGKPFFGCQRMVSPRSATSIVATPLHAEIAPFRSISPPI